MKKLFILTIAATVLTSCASFMQSASVPTKFLSTATHTRIDVAKPIVAVMADLDVSPEKITYLYVPSKSVKNGGFDNIINCAIQEALLENGNADVLVALEHQIKYNSSGECESITVTGYPAKYINFRSPGDEYLREMSKVPAKPEAETAKPGLGLGLGFKLK